MKKLLSLVLVLVMVLGLSVTAFAATTYDLEIGGVAVKAEGELDKTTYTAIKSGTVTYTAAKDGAPAKLTLDNVTCEHGDQMGIYTASSDLVIELKGNNTFNGSNNTIYICGNATFIGTGNLTATNSAIPIFTDGGNCTFSMSGTIEVSSLNIGIYSENGGIYMTPNGGKVIAHGKDNTIGAIDVDGEGFEVVGYKSIKGSADYDVDIEAVAGEVTWTAYGSDEHYYKVGDAVAKTVVLIAYPFPVSGSTEITANVAKPELEYEIVIPQAVTMNEAGVKEIGAASINTAAGKLKNATANTVISYTASGTDFKLKTDSSKTMTATYYSAYTDASTNTVLNSTKAIEVYKNSALVDPLTKLYVGVSQTDWDNAAKTNPGTYTASVTYHFEAKEVVTIGTVLATVDGGFPTEYNPSWRDVESCEYYCLCFEDSGVDKLGFYENESRELFASFELSEILTAVDGGYQFNDGTNVLTFEMTSNKLTSIVAAFGGGSGSGTYTEPEAG